MNIDIFGHVLDHQTRRKKMLDEDKCVQPNQDRPVCSGFLLFSYM